MTTQAIEITQNDIPPTSFEKEMVFGSIKKAMAGASSRDLWNVKASELDTLLVMEGLNVRIKGDALEAHIRALADSMKSEGFKQSKPIEVFILEEGGVSRKYISDGHCRLQAVKLAIAEGAQIEQIPAVTLPTKGVALEDIVVGLVRSNTGKPLTPFETALVCKRLANYSWDSMKIGERLGYSAAYVDMLLEAVSAPMSIVTMMQNGEVSLSTAVETLRKHGSAAIDMLKKGLDNAIASGKTSVSKSYLPGAALGKLLKRQAEPLYEAAKAVTQDPAFSSLSEENQKLLSELLKGIAAKEAAADAKLQKQAQVAPAGQQESEQ